MGIITPVFLVCCLLCCAVLSNSAVVVWRDIHMALMFGSHYVVQILVVTITLNHSNHYTMNTNPYKQHDRYYNKLLTDEHYKQPTTTQRTQQLID